MYSSVVKKLVHDLPNRGSLKTATHRAEGENPVCGDQIELFLQVEEGRVVDCHFQANGCPAAIASAAALTLMVKDKSLQECLDMTESALLEYLEGLPSHKLHGAQLALEVLRRALT
ncbi:MAG TPA: iron-sulfur cluster assembly scaffold protein [Acidobacteriota bacterium]|nr:iron-sulfur cluster assembly scaffold protein [Acidobacteriota bacterium]